MGHTAAARLQEGHIIHSAILEFIIESQHQDFVTIKLRTRYSHDLKKLSKILLSSYDLGT